MYFLFLKIAFSSLSNSSLYHDTTRHGLYFLSASNQLPTNLTRPEKSISHHTWPKSSIISDHPSKYYHNFSDRRRTATDFKYWALNYSPLIIKIYLLQDNILFQSPDNSCYHNTSRYISLVKILLIIMNNLYFSSAFSSASLKC